MKLNIATVLTTLLAATQAAPADTPDALSVAEDAPTTTPAEPRASPSVSDCQQIARNIASGGTWSVGAAGAHHQLVQFGSCAFGVEGKPDMLEIAKIENQDIIDLINDSIQRFQWNGKVGAKGVMSCQTKGAGTAQFLWGIY